MPSSELLKRSGTRNLIAAVCLLCCLGGAIVQGGFGYSGVAIAVVPLFGVYLAIGARNIARVGWVLLGFALAVAFLALAEGVETGVFVESAERVVFMSALLTAVAFLRIAATNDRVVEGAGEFLTLQPPGRRYASLGAGGHLFGVLLNLGGLGVMLEVIMKGCTRIVRRWMNSSTPRGSGVWSAPACGGFPRSLSGHRSASLSTC